MRDEYLPSPPPRKPIRRFFRWLLDPYILPRPGENPLADFVFGIYPASQRRARRAAIVKWGPCALYLALLLVFYMVSNPLHEWLGNYPIFFIHFPTYINLLAQSAVAGVVALGHEFFESAPARIRGNWYDYRMAGLSTREMLVGLAAPSIRSSVATFIVFVAVGTPFVWHDLNVFFGPRAFVLHTLLVALITPLVCLDLALWIPLGRTLTIAFWRTSRVARVTALCAIPATSPLLWLFYADSIIDMSLWDLWRAILNFSVCIFLVLSRPLIVATIWNRTLRRLEDDDGPKEWRGHKRGVLAK